MMMELYVHKNPVAKKEYHCALCGRRIRPGDRYVRIAEKYDGDFFDLIYDEVCDRVITAYACDCEESEYDQEIIAEYLTEKHCYKCECFDEKSEYYDECPYWQSLDCLSIRRQYE